jgi:hypothetical protein
VPFIKCNLYRYTEEALAAMEQQLTYSKFIDLTDETDPKVDIDYTLTCVARWGLYKYNPVD